ncbi:hypothetical protein TNCV_1657481 [Trichonephila clavipes]|nr:hypothetical protein TNCV_1657481 [Trichonephila clavipes]
MRGHHYKWVIAQFRDTFDQPASNMSTMSQLSHLTDFRSLRVVGRLERGQTEADKQRKPLSVTMRDFNLEPFLEDWKCRPKTQRIRS